MSGEGQLTILELVRGVEVDVWSATRYGFTSC
jgi:hypothetical protein